MKSRAALALVACLLLGAVEHSEPFRLALPGYQYQFPRDYFSHPEFRTEWWYYTGNLRSAEGRRFGFELTFFRFAVEPDLPASPNVWDVRDVWMAHLALSDIEGGRFFNTERLNRSGAGLAGADGQRGLVWNGNWSVQWILDATAVAGFREKQLRAVEDQFALDLMFTSEKPPVVHGSNGVSQKSAGAGRASHYISLTRLKTHGRITLEGKPFTVEGLTWMDHEFFSHGLGSDQAGWDWFSLKFDDGTELMLYRLRRKDGTVEPLSSATFVDNSGKSRFLKLSEFSLEPGSAAWNSSKTGGIYPIEWTVRVPSLSLACTVRTRLPQQELTGKFASSPSYWEGAIEVEGTRGGKPIHGAGYLELTGYAAPLEMR